MSIIGRIHTITPADDVDRSLASYSTATRHHEAITSLQDRIRAAERDLAAQCGTAEKRAYYFNGIAQEAVDKTDLHVHMGGVVDELKVALAILEVQAQELGI